MTAICVLGMHRSGTSATAKLLDSLGVYLGPEQHLLGPAADNPEGFFEHLGILQVDEVILKGFGGSWDAPPAFPVGWQLLPRLNQLKTEAKRMIEADFGSHPLWGWKEPRTCLTLPFWKEVVTEVRYVVCLRNPIEVAASLEARNQMPFADAVQLWLEYNISALLYTAGHPRLVFSYDRYSSDRPAQLRRLARFVGLRVPRKGSTAYAEIMASFRDDLRHHKTSAELVDQDSRLTPAEKVFAEYLDRASAVSDGPDGIEASTLLEHYRRVSIERSRGAARAFEQASRTIAELREEAGRTQPASREQADFDRLVSGIGGVLEETLNDYSAKLREALDEQQRWIEGVLVPPVGVGNSAPVHSQKDPVRDVRVPAVSLSRKDHVWEEN